MEKVKSNPALHKPQARNKNAAGSNKQLKVYEALTKNILDSLSKMKASGNWDIGFAPSYGGGWPMNIRGTGYTALGNAMNLFFDSSSNDYKYPVYMTIDQIKNLKKKDNRFHINDDKKWPWTYTFRKYPKYYLKEKYKNLAWSKKNPKGLESPIYYSQFKKLSKEDKDKYKEFTAKNTNTVINIQATNFKEIFPEEYKKIVQFYETGKKLPDGNGMYANPETDRMIEKQDWLYPFEFDQNLSCAFFRHSQDMSTGVIALPFKEQFKTGKTPEEVYVDGQKFYDTAWHEIGHSTGKERLKENLSYNDEEFVAEMTSAIIGAIYGFNSGIRENNVRYVDSWIESLREDPNYIQKKLPLINDSVAQIMAKLDDERIALGMKPVNPSLVLAGKSYEHGEVEGVAAEGVSEKTPEGQEKADESVKEEKTGQNLKALSNGEPYSFGFQDKEDMEKFRSALDAKGISSAFKETSAFWERGAGPQYIVGVGSDKDVHQDAQRIYDGIFEGRGKDASQDAVYDMYGKLFNNAENGMIYRTQFAGIINGTGKVELYPLDPLNGLKVSTDPKASVLSMTLDELNRNDSLTEVTEEEALQAGKVYGKVLDDIRDGKGYEMKEPGKELFEETAAQAEVGKYYKDIHSQNIYQVIDAWTDKAGKAMVTLDERLNLEDFEKDNDGREINGGALSDSARLHKDYEPVSRDKAMEIVDEKIVKRHELDYSMLARLKQDCDYYLGHGFGSERQLWAESVREQIGKMREFYDKLPENHKPEWCTKEDIDTYEHDMSSVKRLFDRLDYEVENHNGKARITLPYPIEVSYVDDWNRVRTMEATSVGYEPAASLAFYNTATKEKALMWRSTDKARNDLRKELGRMMDNGEKFKIEPHIYYQMTADRAFNDNYLPPTLQEAFKEKSVFDELKDMEASKDFSRFAGDPGRYAETSDDLSLTVLDSPLNAADAYKERSIIYMDKDNSLMRATDADNNVHYLAFKALTPEQVLKQVKAQGIDIDTSEDVRTLATSSDLAFLDDGTTEVRNLKLAVRGGFMQDSDKAHLTDAEAVNRKNGTEYKFEAYIPGNGTPYTVKGSYYATADGDELKNNVVFEQDGIRHPHLVSIETGESLTEGLQKAINEKETMKKETNEKETSGKFMSGDDRPEIKKLLASIAGNEDALGFENVEKQEYIYPDGNHGSEYSFYLSGRKEDYFGGVNVVEGQYHNTINLNDEDGNEKTFKLSDSVMDKIVPALKDIEHYYHVEHARQYITNMLLHKEEYYWSANKDNLGADRYGKPIAIGPKKEDNAITEIITDGNGLTFLDKSGHEVDLMELSDKDLRKIFDFARNEQKDMVLNDPDYRKVKKVWNVYAQRGSEYVTIKTGMTDTAATKFVEKNTAAYAAKGYDNLYTTPDYEIERKGVASLGSAGAGRWHDGSDKQQMYADFANNLEKIKNTTANIPIENGKAEIVKGYYVPDKNAAVSLVYTADAMANKRNNVYFSLEEIYNLGLRVDKDAKPVIVPDFTGDKITGTKKAYHLEDTDLDDLVELETGKEEQPRRESLVNLINVNNAKRDTKEGKQMLSYFNNFLGGLDLDTPNQGRDLIEGVNDDYGRYVKDIVNVAEAKEKDLAARLGDGFSWRAGKPADAIEIGDHYTEDRITDIDVSGGKITLYGGTATYGGPDIHEIPSTALTEDDWNKLNSFADYTKDVKTEQKNEETQSRGLHF